jgi:hypothetical protein
MRRYGDAATESGKIFEDEDEDEGRGRFRTPHQPFATDSPRWTKRRHFADIPVPNAAACR